MGDGRAHYTISILAATGKAKLIYGTADDVTNRIIDLEAQRY